MNTHLVKEFTQTHTTYGGGAKMGNRGGGALKHTRGRVKLEEVEEYVRGLWANMREKLKNGDMAT